MNMFKNDWKLEGTPTRGQRILVIAAGSVSALLCGAVAGGLTWYAVVKNGDSDYYIAAAIFGVLFLLSGFSVVRASFGVARELTRKEKFGAGIVFAVAGILLLIGSVLGGFPLGRQVLTAGAAFLLLVCGIPAIALNRN